MVKCNSDRMITLLYQFLWLSGKNIKKISGKRVTELGKKQSEC